VAIGRFHSLAGHRPQTVGGLRARGDAYLNLGKQPEAVGDYEKAMKLEPNDYGILNNPRLDICHLARQKNPRRPPGDSTGHQGV